MRKINVDLSKLVAFMKANAATMSADAIAEQFDVSRNFITKVAASQGIVFSEEKKAHRLALLRQYMAEQRPIEDAAKALGLTKDAMIRFVVKHMAEYPLRRHQPVKPKPVRPESPWFNVHQRENWLI